MLIRYRSGSGSVYLFGGSFCTMFMCVRESSCVHLGRSSSRSESVLISVCDQ